MDDNDSIAMMATAQHEGNTMAAQHGAGSTTARRVAMQEIELSAVITAPGPWVEYVTHFRQ